MIKHRFYQRLSGRWLSIFFTPVTAGRRDLTSGNLFYAPAVYSLAAIALLAGSPLLVKADQLCPEAALSRVVRHRITASDTLDSIASQYHLLPTTMLGMNPGLSSRGPLPVGSELLIPPFNGIRVDVSPGQTWSEVASAYGTQADILFEANGCQATVPQRVFIPGVNWYPELSPEPAERIAIATTQTLSGYPLPTPAAVTTSYGWQPHPSRDEIVFNSGITFAAVPGTEALAVGDGIVAFAGTQGEMGNLVVINHAQGIQTRYANLDEISLSVGQSVSSGDIVGKVGGNDPSGQSFLYFEVRTNSALGWVARNPGQYLPTLELR